MDRRRSDPSGHDRAIEIDAVARVDAGLTIERNMIAIFTDQDVRQKPGKAAPDRSVGIGFCAMLSQRRQERPVGCA
jgi:hypothetical protein